MIARLAALTVLDIVLIGAGALGLLSPALALAGHALLVALAYHAWLRGATRIGTASAMLGILGPGAILLTLPLAGRVARGPVPDDDTVFGDHPAPATRRSTGAWVARMLDGRVHHAAPETLGSFVTILRHGDVAARRRALETVVRSFTPALSPLIAQALTDDDQTIRALAAAASARVAQNLASARAALDARIAADDDGSAEAAATLAALLADHARADVLLSDSQRAHLRDDAIALLSGDHGARDTLAIEAAWAAGDYAAIDRLTADAAARPGTTANWWRAEAAA